MDRFLFEEFVIPLNDEMLDSFYKMIFVKAQDKVEYGEISYYNYYPQERRYLQLILETKKHENNINVENMFFHHSSDAVWKLKIINPLINFPNTYLVSRENGEGCVIIRLVNESVYGKQLKEGDIIEAQVSAFAITGEIFETEKDYIESIPISKNGEKYLMGEGTMIPLNLILNNNANLSKKGRSQREHIKDNLISVKGTIKSANDYKLNMFDLNLPKYYSIKIDTEYGELPIFFTNKFLNSKLKGFGEGNVIQCELFLSGDICINEYDKYIKSNNLIIK